MLLLMLMLMLTYILTIIDFHELFKVNMLMLMLMLMLTLYTDIHKLSQIVES